MAETERTKETKVIRVRGDVYDKVAELAQKDERTMGGQVAFVVKSLCKHPLESREELMYVAAPVYQATKKNPARVGKNRPLRGFFCSTCGQYVIFNASEEVNAAVNNITGTVQ